MKFIRSILSISFFTILSRVAGFFREIILASLAGASALTDVISIAIKVPSMLRRLLAEGAFNAVFVPSYSGILEQKGKKAANTWAEEIFSFLTIVLIGLVIFFELFAPWLVPFFVPGFGPERYELALIFIRVTFPFIIFISLTALFSGILNSFDRFALAASSPVAGNLFIIFFLLLFNAYFPTPGHTFCAAAVISGLVQLLWVAIPSYKAGNTLKIIFPKKLSPAVKTFLKAMVPGAIGSGVMHINALISMQIGSFLPKGSLSYLHFSDRLGQLPLSVVGTAIGTALLPLMSKQIKSKNKDIALKSQNRALELGFLLIIPAMLGLILLAEPIISVVYQHGKFNAQMAHATSKALMAFSIGLPAYVLIKVFTTNFFARGNTSTPVKVAAASAIFNIILTLVLIKPLKYVGISLSLAITSWMDALILGLLLKKKGFFQADLHLKHFFGKLVLCCFITLGVTISLYSYIPSLLSLPSLSKTLYLSALIAVAALTYIGSCILVKIIKVKQVFDF